MKEQQNINFVRPDSSKLPQVSLPFYGYSTGMITHHPGENIQNREIPNFVELIWSIDGFGEVSLYGKKFEMHPNDIFYYLPGEQHDRRAVSPNWTVRWLCFDGPFAESILLSYRYPRHLHTTVRYPAETFAILEKQISSSSPLDIRNCSAFILQILAAAGGYGTGIKNTTSLIDRALVLISSRLSDPALDVQMLCDELQVSKAKLTRIFNREVGVAPGRYILNRRLDQAQSLLTGSNEPIHVVAQRCGFSDAQTFLKFIRRSLGVSPLKIRQKYSGSDPAETE